MRKFLGNSDPEVFKTQQNIQPANKYLAVAVVFLHGGKKIRIVDKNELFGILTERRNSLIFLQEFLSFEGKTKSSTSLETFYCEFRENKGLRNFFFSKKFTIFEEKADNPHSEAFIPEYWKIRSNRRKIQEITNKSLDKKLNGLLEETMVKVMGVIERKGVKIVKSIGKFIIDEKGNCYFKGLKEVFIEKREFIEEIELEEVLMRKVMKEKSKIAIRKNLKGVYSINLRRGLMEEKCEGDFCDFVGLKMIK